MTSHLWRLANSRRPKGLLDRTKKFLPCAGNLSACSVTVPINMDAKVATAMAGGLYSKHVRSLELWWDGTEKKLRVVLVAEAQDMNRFRADFGAMYPNAAFSDLGKTVPDWYDPAKSRYQIFDAGTRHGHYAAVYDGAKSHQLMTRMANAVQSCKYAWVQFTFTGYDFTPQLDRYAQRLDTRYMTISNASHHQSSDKPGHANRKPHDRLELGRDFTNNYSYLQKHASQKRQGRHTLLSIRGLAQTDSDIDLPFDMIETAPVGNANLAYDHLTTFGYDYDRFWSGTKKPRFRWRRKDALQRIRIFESRLLPDPRRLLNDAYSRYFDKAWLRGYRERLPLPFIIVTQPEMPVFLHLPDPSTPSIDTTRGMMLPSSTSDKTGAGIGSFSAQEGHDEPDGDLILQETEKPGGADT